MSNRSSSWGKGLWVVAGVWAAGCVFPSVDVVDEPTKPGRGGNPGDGGTTAVTEQGGAPAEQGGTNGTSTADGGTTSNGGGVTDSAGAPSMGGGGTAGRVGTAGTAARGDSAGAAGSNSAGSAGYNGYTVHPNGYVTSGIWQGWPWVSASGTGSTIAPADVAVNLTNGRLCVSGTAAAVGDGKLGIALNHPFNGPVGTVKPTSNGLVVNVENRGTSAIRVCLYNESSVTWCVALTKFSTDVVIPWSSFSTLTASSGTDLRYSKQPISGVKFVVVSTGVDVPFSFCINNLVEHVPVSSGAGGAAGAAGASSHAGTAGRAGNAATAGQAGNAVAAGAAAVAGAMGTLRRWEFSSTASGVAGAAGAAAIDSWGVDDSSATNTYAVATRAADSSAGDGRIAQLAVLQVVNTNATTGTINPTFSIDLETAEGKTLDAQGRTIYARWRIVSPVDPSTLVGDTIKLYALSSYNNVLTSTTEGWLWVDSAPTWFAAVADHDWHVTFWPLPAKITDLPTSSYWDPTQLRRLGVVFQAPGVTTGVVPFVLAIDSVWIE